MTDVNPLYVDGPLKGKDCAVPADTLRTGLRVPAPYRPILDYFLAPASVEADTGPDVATYHFHRFAIFGRILWIGSAGWSSSITEADLFDLIVSDRAKQAIQSIDMEGSEVSEPIRRTERRKHLDASVVPVERALLARAAALETQVPDAAADPAKPDPFGIRIAAAVIAAELRALAEELRYW